MVLNYIWIGFFLIALLVAIIKTTMGDTEVFTTIVNSTFDMAEVGFEISIGLTGVLCLWLGIMKIGENGGAVNLLARLVGPFFSKLFPDVPENHPARGAMLMNFSANMLGLDNAATPMGLKAMKDLQEINTEKDKASNAMIMFLVLNTSGLTLIPVTVMTYRSQYGAENPADIFIPILIATFFASLIGLITVAIYQKINLLDKVILAYLGSITAVIIGMIWYFSTLSETEVATQSALLSNIILFGIICGFIIMGLFKKVNIYESFIEGAKDGFGIAIKIIPYLIAILVSIGVFRASGAMDYLLDGFEWFFSLFFSDVRFVEGLPTALMKPLSGSGARGMMIDTFNTHGVDSFIGHLTATLQGATDTTFYIIAVYFGSVGIRKTRYAVKAGLLADLAGIVAGIIIATVFFGSSDSKALSPKETVETFTQHWVNLEPTKSMELMHENCVLIDQTYDTAYANPRAITYDFLGADSLAQEKMDIQALNATGDNKSAEVHLKIKRASKLEKEAFTFTIEKGKIRTIKYLGNF